MKIVFLFGGKKGSSETESLGEEYRVRIARSFPAEIAHIASKLSGERAVLDESARILERVDASDFVVLADERGKQMTSPEYSDLLDRAIASGKKRVALVVGGAYGVSEELRGRADVVLSLSRMVFPHEIARVKLLEQTYRALAIRAGSGYHHA